MEKPKGNRMERKKEMTRKKIIAVAVEFFNRQGFDRTTLDQIAEAADIARTTIFNHFSSKEAIVHEYVQRAAGETGGEAVSALKKLPDTRSRLVMLFIKSMEWFENNLNRDVLNKYIVYLMQRTVETIKDKDMRSGFNNMLEPVVRMGQEAGEIRADIPAEELSNHLEWLSASVIILRLAYPEMSLAEVVNREIDLFMSGAVPR